MILKVRKKYGDGRSQWRLFGDVVDVVYDEAPFLFTPWLFFITEDDPESEPEHIDMRGVPHQDSADHDLVMMVRFTDGKSDDEIVIFNGEAFLCNDNGDTLERIPNHPGAWRHKPASVDVDYEEDVERVIDTEERLSDYRRSLMGTA